MKSADPIISRLLRALEGPLPGPRSQIKMAPAVRLENRHGYYRNAAVLILLYPADGQWKLVLMKRPEYEGAHSNQVSLPGGIHEKTDPDLRATALREAREELGIDESRVDVLGGLSKLVIPVSGIEVTPFVGAYPVQPVFTPQESEVKYLIEVSLSELLSPENRREEDRTILGRIVKVPYFDLGNEHVWGATAMILSEFIDLVKGLD